MRIRRTVAGVALTTLSAGLLATIPFTAANAVSPNLVISEVYGGGGNAGATYTHDFVELYNRGTAPVSSAGLSVQYASSTGHFTAVVALPDRTVPAGGYLLVQMGQGAGGTTPLPTPEASGNIAMSGTSGKVVLASGTTAMACNSAASCDTSRIVDLVGYGSAATYFEGAPTATLSNTTSAARASNGADTDNNAVDFSRGDPTPRNSEPPLPDPDPIPLTIAEIQGDGARSDYVGQKVTTTGVVTGDFQEDGEYGGFFLQSTSPDADPLTSDGIRVFQSTTQVAPGDLVTVTGPVEEFASSSSLYSGSETQLGRNSVVTVTGTSTAPAPVALSLPFAPTQDGVAGQERYEGTLVTLPSGLIATDLFTLGRFGEVSLTTDELLRIPTSAEEDAANNADRITLDDGLSGQNLEPLPYTLSDGTLPRAGDALAEPVTGVFSYSFGEYRVEPAVGTRAGFTSFNPRTAAPDAVGGDVQVASFNVLNYFTTTTEENPDARGADDEAELARQQAKLVSAITALDADVVGLIEIANDDGEALATLVGALNDAQSGTEDDYTAVQAPPLTAPNEFGGTYGTDAIRTAIIYRASVVRPAGPPPSDPALLNPADHPDFPAEPLFDRPPAVQEFIPVGGDREFTVIVNHFKSKGSSNAQCGPPDPFGGNCDDLRERQAAGILDLVDALGTDSALLLGDFNAYEEEEPVEVIREGGFVSAEASMPIEDRYSYSFDGEFGTLDYVFLSQGLADALTGVDIWHINSPEAPANDYNDFNQESLYDPGPFASSDHDPALIGLELVNDAPVADAGGPYTTRVGRDLVLDATGSSDEEGAALSFAWDLDGDGAFDDATGPRPTFKHRAPGTYTVAVQVSDGTSTDVDEASVTITTPNGSVPPGRR